MGKKITVDPITRLEGHGKIEIFLDEKGDVEKAYFVIPELRGFEIFSLGRPAEDMPQITPRICGVCPTAHHMASTKTLDNLYKVDPPTPAKKLREMLYNIFMLEDHALHFYILAGPDFVVGPNASRAERNILGVIGKVGLETGKTVIAMRRELRELITHLAGKVIHPVWGLPGGVSKGLTKEDQERYIEVAEKGVEFALFTNKLFHDVVLKNKEYKNLILSDAYTHRTYYMGLVDENNKVNFYDGMIKIVDPEGKEYAKFEVQDYWNYIEEHVEPWSYVKFPYLKGIGWKGFQDGIDSGVYSVAPLARLNASDGMATPKAQEAYEEMYDVLGGKPVHYTLANHWARIVEMIYAAERILELAKDDEITSDNIRNMPRETPTVGYGVVEAPRGTLIHHYETDEKGLITKCNLIVATQNNAARIAMSVDKAARSLIKGGKVDDGLLNMVEMAFRAYDPCHACATHSLPGRIALSIVIYDHKRNKIDEIKAT
ncbi:MAG TPA: Ni/Fe hydrogenase subunit alpha [Candidatus Altiarchaeales archaeon]|nr:Ni/Fe hydrogenase subunit alpha [Candidatus Altiarchaeales archaeon]